MAAAALLRSMARKLARAAPPPPRPLLAAGLHGGATAGLGSGATLATKIARAPSQPHRRHILNRRLHSGSTPPPTTDKDKIIEGLRLRLRYATASAGISGVMLTGIWMYGYFGLLPAVEKERERLKKLKPEYEHPSVSLAQFIARKGHMKQQLNGTTEKGTRVDKLKEEDVMAVCLDILNEMRADLNIDRKTPSKQKEGCSRVGSETVSTS